MASAWMWAFIILVVFFLLAVVIANLIVFKPKDPGTTTRRIWFWVLCIATPVVSYIINYVIAKDITVPTLQSSYLLHSAIASIAVAVIFFLAGYVVSKIFANSKVGTWF